jgi:hypothetical protein
MEISEHFTGSGFFATFAGFLPLQFTEKLLVHLA